MSHYIIEELFGKCLNDAVLMIITTIKVNHLSP